MQTFLTSRVKGIAASLSAADLSSPSDSDTPAARAAAAGEALANAAKCASGAITAAWLLFGTPRGGEAVLARAAREEADGAPPEALQAAGARGTEGDRGEGGEKGENRDAEGSWRGACVRVADAVAGLGGERVKERLETAKEKVLEAVVVGSKEVLGWCASGVDLKAVADAAFSALRQSGVEGSATSRWGAGDVGEGGPSGVRWGLVTEGLVWTEVEEEATGGGSMAEEGCARAVVRQARGMAEEGVEAFAGALAGALERCGSAEEGEGWRAAVDGALREGAEALR